LSSLSPLLILLLPTCRRSPVTIAPPGWVATSSTDSYFWLLRYLLVGCGAMPLVPSLVVWVLGVCGIPITSPPSAVFVPRLETALSPPALPWLPCSPVYHSSFSLLATVSRTPRCPNLRLPRLIVLR